MNIAESSVKRLTIRDIDRLDTITVFLEDYGPRQGSITIKCYGKAWTAYWGGMGELDIAGFFCSCDEHYIAKNLSDIQSTIYDIDAIQDAAEKKGVECHRDDPWNDYEFLNAMYGGDIMEWHDSLPKMPNPDYRYLCRIILAVQRALRTEAAEQAA